MGQENALALIRVMWSVKHQARFLSDFQRYKRRGYDIEELLVVVDLLAEDGVLPPAYHPHRLSGEWKGLWECHIEPDWLLI